MKARVLALIVHRGKVARPGDIIEMTPEQFDSAGANVTKVAETKVIEKPSPKVETKVVEKAPVTIEAKQVKKPEKKGNRKK